MSEDAINGSTEAETGPKEKRRISRGHVAGYAHALVTGDAATADAYETVYTAEERVSMLTRYLKVLVGTEADRTGLTEHEVADAHVKSAIRADAADALRRLFGSAAGARDGHGLTVTVIAVG